MEPVGSGPNPLARTRAVRSMIAVAVVAGVAACTSADPNADLSAADPYEGTNRAIHKFNLALDRNVLYPVAQGYDAVTPTTIKHILGNGFSHLDLPGNFANHLLQGEIDPALRTLGRFTINTVLGAGGLLDPATEFGLPKEDTDFGVTLGKAGVGEGPYLILPLLGPTTGRDLAGSIVDVAFRPTTYIGAIDASLTPEVPMAIRTLDVIDARDRNKDVIDDVLYKSEDSYVSLRSVYLQRRRALVAGDTSGADALPNIFEN